ncbi:hypothetical protein LTR56_023882 [Elasticomyces elasticus]|nr:hypothetical protein LTR56_023882 [Elasticomyces elasticus]KAK3620269.1 hypothetical protein LTR22_025662 [Elasticomyces elasticus]KAK4913377.1 hypothetical protein LTR49_018265 [Elasticomyces elasticus]KAK5754583.1 hypothetical protein LTS12_015307 [Elasticomyces elasticus]
MALNSLLHRREPTWFETFENEPTKTLARTLWRYQRTRKRLSHEFPITVICISDTHNTTPALPAGDILIHAGDLTQGGTKKELQAALDWLNAQPHEYKVVIAGNHELLLDRRKTPNEGKARKALRWGSIIYLNDSCTTLRFRGGRTLKVYGNPWTWRHGNWAFQYDPGEDIFSNQIPEDADIVVTHSPPRYHLDLAAWGDDFLLREIWRVRPRLHVFGHLHAGYGQEVVAWDRVQDLYERIYGGSRGILALLLLAFYVGIGWLRLGSLDVPTSTLVNAAAVGGQETNGNSGRKWFTSEIVRILAHTRHWWLSSPMRISEAPKSGGHGRRMRI